jgi:hypothetical protein
MKDTEAFATPSATPSAVAAAGERIVGVRFSLYPNVGKETPPSLKAAVKAAVVGLGELGLSIRPDDVSSCLVGKEGHVIEALQSCFARASVTTDGTTARGISMQGTLSHGYEDFSSTELPVRTAVVEDGREFVPYAYMQPPRIAAQFAVYPKMDGTGESYETIMDAILKPARASPCWKDSTDRQLCFMLDGDGNQVFEVLRETFALACAESTAGVAMTMTLTANKSAWPESDRSQPM